MTDSPAVECKSEGVNPLNKVGKSEMLSVILTDPHILHCSICYEPLSIPVFQCENGHISCSDCCNKIKKKCPSCRFAIGHIRCRAIESVLESLKLPCKNKKYGCTMLIKLNQPDDHESMCMCEPCSCPSRDCFFVGSSEQLYIHFKQNHKTSAKSFSYSSRFTMCLNPKDCDRILQSETDGALFLLTLRVELFGNAVTVSWIGPSSSEKKFCCEIKAKAEANSLCFLSMVRVIQGQFEIPISKGFLLIPNDFFGSSPQMILEFRIWPAL